MKITIGLVLGFILGLLVSEAYRWKMESEKKCSKSIPSRNTTSTRSGSCAYTMYYDFDSFKRSNINY